MNEFSLRNPAIIPTQKFGDGEFYAYGNIVLGMDLSRNNFLSFNIQPIQKGCFCSLFIWEFDRFYLSLSNPKKQILLFTKNGLISANPNNFEVTLIEVTNKLLKYFIIGRSISSDPTFLYISLILEDEKIYNFHFSSNDTNFEFDASTSILFNPLSISINCVSSIKIITIKEESSEIKIKTTQFDVENYLKMRLQCNIKNIEFYETSIIEKNTNESSFIIFIGFYFYNERNNKWTTAFILMNVPVNGATMRQIHQESICFEKRPQGDLMKEKIFEWKKQFQTNVHQKNEPKINLLTNKNLPGKDLDGVRLIKIPEMNLIIADERNGVIKF